MPVYDNQNSGAAVASVNTNSLPLFAADGTMLRIGFKNDTMFLSIIPKIVDPNGGRSRWPKEMGHTANIRPHLAMALYEGFRQKILPDIEAQKDHDGYCVVPLNRESTNLCGFTYAGGHAIFSIFNNVGADRTTSEIHSFMFDPTPIINDYNPTTGTYNVLEIQGQLFVIMEALRTWGAYSPNVIGHTVKNANAWNADMLMSHVRAIATKLGATPGQYGAYRGPSNYGNGNAFAAEGAMNNYNGVSSVGGNENVTWQNGMDGPSAGSAQSAVTQVQAVSSLDALMGGNTDGDLPF